MKGTIHNDWLRADEKQQGFSGTRFSLPPRKLSTGPSAGRSRATRRLPGCLISRSLALWASTCPNASCEEELFRRDYRQACSDYRTADEGAAVLYNLRSLSRIFPLPPFDVSCYRPTKRSFSPARDGSDKPRITSVGKSQPPPLPASADTTDASVIDQCIVTHPGSLTCSSAMVERDEAKRSVLLQLKVSPHYCRST